MINPVVALHKPVVSIVGVGSSRNQVIALLPALALYLAPQASAASTACLHPSPSARPATLVSNFFSSGVHLISPLHCRSRNQLLPCQGGVYSYCRSRPQALWSPLLKKFLFSLQVNHKCLIMWGEDDGIISSKLAYVRLNVINNTNLNYNHD